MKAISRIFQNKNVQTSLSISVIVCEVLHMEVMAGMHINRQSK
jgi:hypothetical protein